VFPEKPVAKPWPGLENWSKNVDFFFLGGGVNQAYLSNGPAIGMVVVRLSVRLSRMCCG